MAWAHITAEAKARAVATRQAKAIERSLLAPWYLEQYIWRRISPEPMSGCWIWTGVISKKGYGEAWTAGGAAHKKIFHQAHRLVFEFYRGPIPSGLQLDHLCRNRCCVNPEHLEPVTPRENTRRGIWANKTHCRNGHALVAGNLKTRKDRYRECLMCHRISGRKTASKRRLRGRV